MFVGKSVSRLRVYGFAYIFSEGFSDLMKPAFIRRFSKNVFIIAERRNKKSECQSEGLHNLRRLPTIKSCVEFALCNIKTP